MLTFSVIGNLGADAQVKNINGRNCVTFDVAHSDSWTDESGVQHNELTWVSCIMNGDGGKLLPFLTKGRKVFVQGDGRVRVYSSAVQRRMCAGANLSVRQIELIGGQSDEVPRRLATPTGELVDVTKAYYIDPAKAKELCPKETDTALLHSERGETFQVQQAGWVQKLQEPTPETDANDHF